MVSVTYCWVDSAFSEVIKQALALCTRAPLVIDIVDNQEPGELIGQ